MLAFPSHRVCWYGFRGIDNPDGGPPLWNTPVKHWPELVSNSAAGTVMALRRVDNVDRLLRRHCITPRRADALSGGSSELHPCLASHYTSTTYSPNTYLYVQHAHRESVNCDFRFGSRGEVTQVGPMHAASDILGGLLSPRTWRCFYQVGAYASAPPATRCPCRCCLAFILHKCRPGEACTQPGRCLPRIVNCVQGWSSHERHTRGSASQGRPTWYSTRDVQRVLYAR